MATIAAIQTLALVSCLKAGSGPSRRTCDQHQLALVGHLKASEPLFPPKLCQSSKALKDKDLFPYHRAGISRNV